MTQHKSVEAGLGWALVKPTLNATEYIPVEIIRRGKRFTFVRTLRGDEWRYSSRGLWDGFDTEDAAYAEIQKMRDAHAALSSARGNQS